MPMKLHFAGESGEGFGWGRFCHYMIQELGKLCELTGPDNADVVFMPLADHDLNASTPARAKRNVGMCFFEYPLGPNAAANAAKYDIVFCGSTWNKERLAERGITNTEVLIQGVDTKLFNPQPPRPDDGEFRIFSGGKFEWRKGQDLVLAAFKMLFPHYPQMRLVVSWHNLWPQLYQTMNQSAFIQCPRTWTADWPSNLKLLLDLNGIPRDRVYVMPPSPQEHMAWLMGQTDCGVFPNRCEGGTNLVLMEYAACGRPVIANVGTGQADVADLISQQIAGNVSPESHWFYSRPHDVVEQIVKNYTTPSSHDLTAAWPWTWDRAAKTVFDSVAALG